MSFHQYYRFGRHKESNLYIFFNWKKTKKYGSIKLVKLGANKITLTYCALFLRHRGPLYGKF